MTKTGLSNSESDPFDWLTVGAQTTEYLNELKVTHRARARAARSWRPRFLKALATGSGVTSSLKAANVAYNTFRSHEERDPVFASQVADAQAEGVELLHDACWITALEGTLEPIYHQGKLVGEVRRVDNRLRLEMLRAYMPTLFKTPGKNQISVPSENGPLLQMTPEVAARLQARRREAIAASLEAKRVLTTMADTNANLAPSHRVIPVPVLPSAM